MVFCFFTAAIPIENAEKRWKTRNVLNKWPTVLTKVYFARKATNDEELMITINQ